MARVAVKWSILAFSIYISCSTRSRDLDNRRLLTRLKLVREAYRTERSQNPELEVILTGDFNRWDSLWGGRERWGDTRQGEANEIVHLMSDLDLQLLLPPETPTYHSTSQEGIVNASTLDLIFASEQL